MEPDQQKPVPLSSCHVEVHVTDLARARHFYVEQLGMAILQDTPQIGLLALNAGGMRLSVFGDRAADTLSHKSHTHIVLGTADLGRQIEVLEHRGVVFEGPVIEASGFCRFVQTRDPDGNLVEIAQYLRDPLSAI